MCTTAHFVGPKDHKWNHVTLAVRRFLHPHTGKRVREVVQEVLAEWNIPLAKVFAILTDNGSNMLKAFHSSFVESEDDQDDKGSSDQEEKDAYEKEQGDVE